MKIKEDIAKAEIAEQAAEWQVELTQIETKLVHELVRGGNRVDSAIRSILIDRIQHR